MELIKPTKLLPREILHSCDNLRRLGTTRAHKQKQSKSIVLPVLLSSSFTAHSRPAIVLEQIGDEL